MLSRSDEMSAKKGLNKLGENMTRSSGKSCSIPCYNQIKSDSERYYILTLFYIYVLFTYSEY